MPSTTASSRARQREEMHSMSAPSPDPAAGLRTADYDGVVVATLDRPPANALNRPLLLAMTALFRDRGENAPPLVITGAGERFFCVGGDIKDADLAASNPV